MDNQHKCCIYQNAQQIPGTLGLPFDLQLVLCSANDHLRIIWQPKDAQNLIWNLIFTTFMLIPCHLPQSCTEHLLCLSKRRVASLLTTLIMKMSALTEFKLRGHSEIMHIHYLTQSDTLVEEWTNDCRAITRHAELLRDKLCPFISSNTQNGKKFSYCRAC